MAIGLGRIFGFKFKENFTHPFAADSIQNFWRRWHISLSTWFKEYLYIPLGGNRLGKWRTGINRVVVFFFTGLWHGASWTFVVWGLIHGFFLLLESYGIIRTDKMWKPLRHIYTLLIVILSFVLFRADNFNQALDFLGSMFLDPTAQ
jgi:alginate O-acetyltransferase complex protein AlgI